jgi:hypothetical protein
MWQTEWKVILMLLINENIHHGIAIRHCNQDYAVRIDTVKVELEKEKQQEAYWKMSLEQ